MADGSTTETITLAGGFDGRYEPSLADGTLDFFPSQSSIISRSWLGPVPITFRMGMQFVWPNALNKTSVGSMLNPSVLATVGLRLNATILAGSPSLTFYMALEPTVTFDATLWPGPAFTAGSAPDSGLTVPTYLNVMPRINGDRKSVAITLGLQTISLDAGEMSRIIDDQPGKTAWDLNFTIIAVVDNELEGYVQGDTGPGTYQVRFTSESVGDTSLEPQLIVEHVPFHTGFMTDAEGATRTVHDARSGMPSLSSDLVEDKYNSGVWVSPHQQDPDDGVIEFRKRTEHRTDNKPVR